MKIAFLMDSFLPDPSTGVNGTQVQNHNLAVAMARMGHEVHCISGTRDRTCRHARYGNLVVHYLQLPQIRIFADFLDIKSYSDLLNRIQPDALYQRGRSTLTFTAARWARIRRKPFVWGSNGEDSCDFWKYRNWLKVTDKPAWKKALYLPIAIADDLLIHQGIRGATAVVNQTEHQRRRLKENYGRDGIVLPNYFLPPETSGRKKQKKVLWLANITRNKQPELFIDLAKQCASLPDWRFLLAGSTTNRALLSSITRKAGEATNLELIGAVPFQEADVLFQDAAVAVNTSIIEGLSNVFIQAWLSGTPVLSLNSDPNGWISQNGLGICAHGDLDAFFEKGRRFLGDSAEIAAAGDRCRAFAEKTFADRSIIDTYLEMFHAKPGR